jgi:hypothetical protein
MSGIVLQQKHGARIPPLDFLVRASTGKAVGTRMPHRTADRGGVVHITENCFKNVNYNDLFNAELAQSKPNDRSVMKVARS